MPLSKLEQLSAAQDVLALYLFGSRADDGLAVLDGKTVTASGSDLDIGVVFRSFPVHHHRLASLQVALEDTFAPLRVDLVPLQRVLCFAEPSKRSSTPPGISWRSPRPPAGSPAWPHDANEDPETPGRFWFDEDCPRDGCPVGHSAILR